MTTSGTRSQPTKPRASNASLNSRPDCLTHVDTFRPDTLHPANTRSGEDARLLGQVIEQVRARPQEALRPNRFRANAVCSGPMDLENAEDGQSAYADQLVCNDKFDSRATTTEMAGFQGSNRKR